MPLSHLESPGRGATDRVTRCGRTWRTACRGTGRGGVSCQSQKHPTLLRRPVERDRLRFFATHGPIYPGNREFSHGISILPIRKAVFLRFPQSASARASVCSESDLPPALRLWQAEGRARIPFSGHCGRHDDPFLLRRAFAKWRPRRSHKLLPVFCLFLKKILAFSEKHGIITIEFMIKKDEEWTAVHSSFYCPVIAGACSPLRRAAPGAVNTTVGSTPPHQSRRRTVYPSVAPMMRRSGTHMHAKAGKEQVFEKIQYRRRGGSASPSRH